MSYQKLEQHQQQLHRFSHLSAICGWDQAAMMPEGGNEARAEAMAELGLLIHHKRTAPELGDWIAKAESEPLDELQRANLREIKRHWQDASQHQSPWAIRMRCSWWPMWMRRPSKSTAR